MKIDERAVLTYSKEIETEPREVSTLDGYKTLKVEARAYITSALPMDEFINALNNANIIK